jgi:hypothetical protein
MALGALAIEVIIGDVAALLAYVAGSIVAVWAWRTRRLPAADDQRNLPAFDH